MEFFKNLTEVVNLESWGAALLPTNGVAKLKTRSHIRFKPVDCADIESISLYNSMCLIFKGHGPNSIGGRVVAVDGALVHTALPKHGSAMSCPIQNKSFYKNESSINDTKHQQKRHHLGRWLGHTALPGDAGGEQTAHAGVRQADDLLPADHAHAEWYSRGVDHFNPARHSAFYRVAGRRQPVGHAH